MLRTRRSWQTLVLASVAALVVGGAVAAQDDAEGEDIAPRAVPPTECAVDPSPVETLASVLALAGEGAPRPAYPAITAPLGEVADTETRTAIKEAARELIACFNAGDIPRAAALMTDNGVRRAYWALSVDAVAREAARARLTAPPQPRPEASHIRLLAVTDASFLPDGRVAAFVVLNDPLSLPRAKTLLCFFSGQDGRWLLDDWVDFVIAPTAPAAPASP